MPEGAEVKLSAEFLNSHIAGKKIVGSLPGTKGRYLNEQPAGYSEFIDKLLDDKGLRITSVDNHGKFMFWTLNKGELYMFCSLAMTGQWSLTENKHTAWWFTFDDKDMTSVYFNDPRHFGSIRFVSDPQVLDTKLNTLGWDPLHQSLNDKQLQFVQNKLTKTRRPIGQVMLDQSVFSGSGNYLRAESLYEAGLSPWRPSSSLTSAEIEKLCQALDSTMNAAYSFGGASFKMHLNSLGEKGKFSNFFKVYGRKTDPQGNPILKQTTPEGRTIHWCPNIQK